MLSVLTAKLQRQGKMQGVVFVILVTTNTPENTGTLCSDLLGINLGCRPTVLGGGLLVNVL